MGKVYELVGDIKKVYRIRSPFRWYGIDVGPPKMSIRDGAVGVFRSQIDKKLSASFKKVKKEKAKLEAILENIKKAVERGDKSKGDRKLIEKRIEKLNKIKTADDILKNGKVHLIIKI